MANEFMDDLDPVIRAELENKRVRFNASLSSAVTINPDDEAKQARLAAFLDRPKGVVAALPADAERAAAIKTVTDNTATSPVLRRKYTDADFAKLAHDDSGVLKSMEEGFGSLLKWSMGNGDNQGFIGAAKAAPFVTAGTYAGVKRAAVDLVEPFARVAAGPDNLFARSSVLYGQQAAGFAAQAARVNPPSDGIVAGGLDSGGNSLVQNAKYLPLALMGPAGAAVALGGIAAETFGQSYNKAADKGIPLGPRVLYAAADGVIEWGTEKGPLGTLVHGVKVGAPIFQTVLRNAWAENKGEQVATALQDLNEWGVLNPDKPFSEYIAARPAAAAQTLIATLVGAGGNVAVAESLQGAVDAVTGRQRKAEYQAQQADHNAQVLEALQETAQASKLLERSPQTLTAYMQELADDGAPTVFVDSAKLVEAGIDLRALAQAVPSVAAQMQSVETGGDFAIPTGELLVGTIGSEFAQPLIDNARTSTDGMSRAEAKVYMQEQGDQIQAEIERVLATKADDAEFKAGRDQVQAQLAQQLNDIKRFTGKVNDQYATLAANFYAVMAARTGQSVQQFADTYKLGFAGQAGSGAQVLEQAPTLAELVDRLSAAGVDTSIGESRGVITLYKIALPKTARGQGHGTAAMQALVEYADATGQHLALSPSGDFGGDKKRLTDFYKRFGFVENKGKNRAFSTRESMYRVAPGKVLEQKARGQIAFGNDVTQQASIVSLFKSADLSTFVHESGHFFLEVQADLAARISARIAAGEQVSPGEQSIADDMGKLLEWMGVKGTPELSALGEWLAMPADQKRPFHEKFARGFEAYAFEGKAPSMDLQKTFQTFRAWLVNVYRALLKSVNASPTDIGGALDVELSPEVRSVMDRMLATSDQIAEAEAARDMGPLFKTAEEAGMTLDEFKAYHDQGVQATMDAVDQLQTRGLKDMQWLQNARSRKLKELQKQHDELRAGITREVRAEVMAQPVYRAWSFLTSKSDEKVVPGVTDVDGAELTTMSGKLRTNVLREMYGTADDAIWRQLSALRMTSDEVGSHPDIIAENFGFDSGDALVQALAAAEPPQSVIQGMTDQRMLQEHGDLASPAGIERAADEAIHNDTRARFVTTELRALQKAMSVREKVPGQKNTVDVLARAAREFADATVARLRVRDVRPSQYAAAEVRSAKAAAKAVGDIATAAMHKRNQLINMYATKSAYAAQDEVKKAVEYFRKFDTPSKSLDPEYSDQIEALLERFDLRASTTLTEIDKRKSLVEWVQQQAEMGLEPNIPDDLLQEANRKSFKDMTVEEVRGLRDTIKQIEHIGRLKNKLLLARDKREFDAVATDMAASIVANGGKVKPLELEGPKPIADWFAGLAASHRKLASLFRQLDGNNDAGPMYEVIGRSMNERGTAEDVMTEKATEALQAIYAPLLKLRGGITGYRSKVSIPEIRASLTRGGRLAVALNWGNEANRQRVMDGDGWTEAQVQAVIKTLATEELAFVNSVWEYLDSYWPEVAAKEKRITGVEPAKVEAQPFVATAADGTQVQMRGGYYPLKYDANRSDRTSQQDAAQVAKEMMQGAFTRATTRRGHTKERTDTVNRAVRKDLNVITQHVSQVVHDLAWHEWLIDTNRLLGDKRVSGAIRDHYGPQVLKTMRDDVMGIATADVTPQTDIDKALLLLRSNVSRATMGGSLTTAFLQPFGLTQSMVRIGPKHVLRGLARWGGDAARMESTMGWINGKSDFMRLRAKTFSKELREIQGSVAGKSKAMQIVDGGLFYLMQKMQAVADVPTWAGQYEKSLAEGLDDAAAVSMADRAVLEAQGGGQTKDLAEIQRKHPMLTQFYSYFSVTLNLTVEQTAKTDFKDPRAVAGWVGDMALLSIIPAILPAFIMYAIKGGDDDEPTGWAKRMAEWQLGYLMGAVVGLRELSGAVSGFDYAGPPVGRVVGDLGKVGNQAKQGELDEPAVMALVNLMGSVFGIPTVQAMRSYKGWKAWSEGQEGAGPQSVLFGPPPKD